MNIRKSNQLIAEYMGWVFEPATSHLFPGGGWERGILPLNTSKDKFKAREFEYSNSWDWLMPVIDKIEKSGYNVSIRNTSGVGYVDKDDQYVEIVACDSRVSGENRLDSVYKAVVRFIEWYNEQKAN